MLIPVKIIEMVLNHSVTSGTSNVTKSRVFEGTFIEFGMGFIENESKYEPWMILNVGGQASKMMGFIESFADVIVSESKVIQISKAKKYINF